MLQVQWVKCNTGNWCNLNLVDLSGVTAGGVYIIWHVGNPSRTVRVGQGDISRRLVEHRADREIQYYAGGGLYVTWASVQAFQRDGVERYLADRLGPLVGDAFPQAAPIVVNLPW